MAAIHRLALVFRLLLAVMAAAVTITCGGDSGTVPEDDGDTPRTLSISLVASTGTSAGRIAVTGIPDDVSDVYAVVSVAAAKAASVSVALAEGEGIAIIDRSGDTDELIVPLHPVAPMAGGDVNIRVTNGSNVTSNTVSLTIEPLPAAPGAFAELVDDVTTLLDAWFAQNGGSRQDLRDTPVEELSLFDLPVLMVYNLVDNPDNPNSLRALADGDIPLFDDGEAFDRDILDAIVAATQLREMTVEKIEFIGTVAPPVIPDPVPAAAFTAGSRAADCIEAPRFSIDANDCDLLAEIMSYQAGLELEAASALEKYKNDLINAGLTLMSWGRAAKIAAGITSSLWAVSTIEEGQSKLYPSQFISDETDFTLDTETFPEDFSSPGHWSEFKVGARSNGWNFEKRVKEAFEQVYGAAQGLDVPEGAPTEINFREKYDGMVKNQLSKDAKKKIMNDDTLDLEYCAQEWHAIDCTGLPHSSGTSTSLKYDSDQLTYEPSEVGTATLVVGTEPIFGLGRATSETKQVVTERLDVFIDPFQAVRDVEEMQDFFARVANAEDENVTWSIVWSGANNEGVFTDDGNNASLTTPSNPWNTPIEIKAKSLSNTGLRKDKVDTDPREDTALVTWSGGPAIKITPGYKCVGNGETFKFTAEAVGIQDYTVIWKRVEGYGSIDQDGNYTAPPSGTTDDVISAEIEGFPEVIDYANVKVGACTCNYVIDINGASTFHEEGGDVAYLFSDLPDGYHSFQFFFMLNTPESGFSMGLGPVEGTPGPRPGDTGIFQASVAYVEPGGAGSWVTIDESSVVLVEILEHTDTYMIANFSGTLAQGEGQSRTTVHVSGSFRAGRWADNGWPCE